MRLKDIAIKYDLDPIKFEIFLYSTSDYKDLVKSSAISTTLPDEYIESAVEAFRATIEPTEEKIEKETDDSLAGQYLDETTYSFASGKDLPYVVLQVTLKEKLIGTGSVNLTELENIINAQAARGYRLHTFSTSTSFSKGLAGGDRIQATMVFERLEHVDFPPVKSTRI